MVQRMSFLALIRAIKWLKTVQLACRIGVSIVHEECRCSARRCRKRAKRVWKGCGKGPKAVQYSCKVPPEMHKNCAIPVQKYPKSIVQGCIYRLKIVQKRKE